MSDPTGYLDPRMRGFRDRAEVADVVALNNLPARCQVSANAADSLLNGGRGQPGGWPAFQ